MCALTAFVDSWHIYLLIGNEKVAKLAIKSESKRQILLNPDTNVYCPMEVVGGSNISQSQSLHAGVTSSIEESEVQQVCLPDLGIYCPMEVANGNDTSRNLTEERSVHILDTKVCCPMEVLGRNGTFINTIHSLDTSVCCQVEAAGKPEYLDNLIEESEMYTENKLKEGTKEQENFNVKVVTTRSSIVKERANESTRSDTGENENFIETFLIQRQLTDHNLRVLIQLKKKGDKPTWADVSSLSPLVKYYWNRWDSLEIVDGILCKKFENETGNQFTSQIITPQSLVVDVLEQLHSSVTGGHLGLKKTFNKIRQKYHWYKMYRDIERWCQKCDVCNSRKMPRKKPKAPLKLYNVGAPLERVAVDIMGPLPKTRNGNLYLLVIGDYFTKWVDALPLGNQEAIAVASKLVDRFISILGVPMQIHSDQGSNFESKVFKEMCNILGIEKNQNYGNAPPI